MPPQMSPIGVGRGPTSPTTPNRMGIARPPERGNLPPHQRPDENWPYPVPGTIPNRPIALPEPLPPATTPAPAPLPSPAPAPLPSPGPQLPPAGVRFGPAGVVGGATVVPAALRAAGQPHAVTPPALVVDPNIVPPAQGVRDRFARERSEQFQALRDLLAQADEGLFGAAESKAATTLLKKLTGIPGAALNAGRSILSPGAAGQGEEAEIARMNEAIRNQRERVAEFLFGLLRLAPPLAGGPGAVLAPPQEQADP